MATATEAPVGEPRTVSAVERGDVEVGAGSATGFGDLEVLEGLDLAVGRRRGRRRRRPLRLRQVDAARAGRRPARRPTRGTVAVGGRRDAGRPPRPLRLHAAARPAAAVALGARQRGARAAQPRRFAGRGAGRGRAPVRALRPRRLRARRGPPSSPAACASGSPSCAPCWPRKPVLLLDEPFASLDAISRAEMQEWLAGALAEQPATVVLVTHDVEEALYLCDRVVVLTARPARALATVESPAPRATPAARGRDLARVHRAPASGRSRRSPRARRRSS